MLNAEKLAAEYDKLDAKIQNYFALLGTVIAGEANDKQRYDFGKSLFNIGSFFVGAGEVNAVRRGLGALKALPKLPSGLRLLAKAGKAEIGIFVEGEATALYSISKSKVHSSSRWYAGKEPAKLIDEIGWTDAAAKPRKVEIVRDNQNQIWLREKVAVGKYPAGASVSEAGTCTHQ